MPRVDEDLRYCREVLPRVSRTFAINIRLLAGSFRDAVGIAYLLCRTADALEDNWPGTPDEIRARFERLGAAIAGDAHAAVAVTEEANALDRPGDDLELVRHFPQVWRAFQSLSDADRPRIERCVLTMCAGMSRYSSRAAERGPGVAYLDSESELHDYCWIVAGCVGLMLTELFSARVPGRTPDETQRRIELAPPVGEALQLTNILLDWPIDMRRGRCYVPGAWLRELDLSPADLVGRARDEVRILEQRLESLARGALSRVPDYLDRVPRRALRYRLFVLLPALWALRSLEVARRDPEFPWGDTRPRLSRGALWRSGLSALLARAPVEDLRRCAVAGA
jgi:farnesyl-diphosphate farnesyltransferase